jgi:branched-chain amino acid transport system substrate-binding protein
MKDDKNDYSIGLANFFKKTFSDLGGVVVAEQAYSEGDADFRSQLTALKNAKPEAIIVPGYYTEAALMVKQARELHITVPFLGGDGWDSAKLLEIGGSAMNGCYYSNHYSADNTDPIVQNFVAKYKARYNETPDSIAALGYDTAKLLADAISRAGSDEPAHVRDALAATKDFPGVTGKITMDSERNANKPAVILEIKNGKVVFGQSVEP